MNPCELVFNVVKKWLRNNKNERTNLRDSIIDAFSFITVEQMVSFYLFCQENTIALKREFIENMEEDE